jgi:hypothetical protein
MTDQARSTLVVLTALTAALISWLSNPALAAVLP